MQSTRSNDSTQQAKEVESLIREIKARALRVEWLHRMGIDDLTEIDEHMRNEPPSDPEEELRQLKAIVEIQDAGE